ncbi:MAG: Phosphocholine transferase AnkX [Spirochaetes bacterium ADurb.Bin133]|nr:MAG: Phosphocholine transferase AnkX [Spirochaetes bacterium ADurb.Bin133]
MNAREDENKDKNIKNSELSGKTVEELNILLENAIKTRDIDAINGLLKTDVDVNNTSGSSWGYTPLCYAVYLKNIDIARLLIESGANVNKISINGETPLKIACSAYKLPPIDDMVKLLLDNGADLNIYDKGKDGPLHCAAMYNQPEAVKLLVQNGADVNVKGNYGRTPLIYSASSARLPEMVKFLIDSGADVNATNDSGENALFELITREESNAEIAKILLDNGIKKDLKNNYKMTALHWAAFCGKTNIIEVLLEYGFNIEEKDAYGNTPIIKAMSQNKIDAVKFLFNKGAKPDSQGQMGFSLLEYATRRGDKDFVRQILSKLSGKDKSSLGSLNEAAKKGDVETLKMLIESGFDVNELSTWASETPLMKAAYHGKLNAVKYLLDNGADVKMKDERGNAALLHAAWGGHTAVVKELIDRGADVNETNNFNWNALMQACVEGRYDTAELLLKAGSLTNLVDKEKGATALTLAIYNGSEKLINLLKSYGAQERSIKMREESEPYFSILDCEICQYLPDQKDLGRTTTPESFKGLEVVHSEYSQAERYCDDTKLIMRCVNCGTYYYQYHSIDSEDVFISGPSIIQRFQRINLVCLKQALFDLGKTGELEELNGRYEAIIKSFINPLKENPPHIKENCFSYAVESVMDYYIINNNWDSLYSILLNSPNENIRLKSARDIISMYGEKAVKGIPLYSYSYRSITSDFKKIFDSFFSKRVEEFAKFLDIFKNTGNIRHKTIIDAAIKHNIL